MKKLIFTVCMLIMSTSAFAEILSFDNPNNLGVTLGGQAYYNGVGGGHIYMDYYQWDDYVYFGNSVYLNSFQMNGLPWEGYGASDIDTIKVSAFNNNVEVWSKFVDLSNYTSWYSWLTVSVETDNVTSLIFYATGSTSNVLERGFWPSVDNMHINEEPKNSPTAATPEPGSMILMGIGAAGAALMRKCKSRAVSVS